MRSASSKSGSALISGSMHSASLSVSTSINGTFLKCRAFKASLISSSGAPSSTCMASCPASSPWGTQWAPPGREAEAVWSAPSSDMLVASVAKLQNHEKEGLGVVRALWPLSAAAMEQWKRHFACDHQPARRDCRVCVESQGRGRAHRRIQHPQTYTLAVDLSGKLAAGKDQRCQAKYFVAAVYTYPVDGE